MLEIYAKHKYNENRADMQCINAQRAIGMDEEKQDNLNMENPAVKIRRIRESTGMNRKEFAAYFDIPYPTITDWELGHRKMPDYVLRLIAYKVKKENLNKK